MWGFKNEQLQVSKKVESSTAANLSLMQLSATNLNSIECVEKMYDFYHKDRSCIPTYNVFEERRNALYWFDSKDNTREYLKLKDYRVSI